MAVFRCSAAVRAIEKRQRRRFQLGNVLLNLDMYERWGHGSDKKMEAELQKADRYASESVQLEKEIRQKCQKLTGPDRIRWAQAHQQLLQAYIDQLSTQADRAATEIYVAKEEIAAWQALARGEQDYVSQNVYYVHYDQQEYQAYFGPAD
ncbi:MAG: hypothetical protein KDK39_10435 [Leptospiraceae bacterium]|nr:hypothetical protein [Leptospiraceae bacterium]